MHTVSFFGFKGGVGRTHLLLSVAYKLAQDGKFVVISDWDLQAPGLTVLEDLARPENEEGYPEGLDVRLGVLDFLGALLSKDQPIPDPKSMAQPTRRGRNARAESLKSGPAFRGDIWFIPAGRFDPEDAHRSYHDQVRSVLSLDLAAWQHDFREEGKGKDPREVLHFFRERVGQVEHPELGKPDYLLIDSRTGMSEIGDLLLGTRFIDRMVILTGLTEQHFAGMEAAIRDLQSRQISPEDPNPVIPPGELRNRLTLVVSPVPQGEEALKRKRLQQLRDRLETLARDIGHGEKEFMPDLLQIPYHPLVALSDGLVVDQFPESELAQAVAKVVADIREREDAVSAFEAVRRVAENTGLLEKPGPVSGNHPLIPYHPWSRMPVWNWPDPSILIERFIPQFTEQQVPLLNGLARSVSLSKQEKEGILDVILKGKLSDFQISELQKIFLEERIKFGDLRKVHWKQLMEISGRHFGEWLDIWSSRGFGEKLGILEAAARGERNHFLGTWTDIGYFWYQLARLAWELKEWNLVETMLRKAIRLDPHFAKPWSDLGSLLLYLKRTEEAEKACRKAIELDPKSGFPWIVLGDLFQYNLQRPEEAEKAYRAAIELDPKLEEAWRELGILLRKQARFEAAEQAFRKAIGLNPDTSFYWHGLGLSLREQKRVQEAEQAYRRAIELDPKSATAWNGLAILLGSQGGRIQEAREAFRKARENDPTDYSPYLNEAEFLLVHGDLEQAEDILQEVVPHLTTDYSKRSHAMLLLALGSALKAPDRVEAAHRSLEALNEACSTPSDWDYDDIAEFLERLEPAARDLLVAWITTVERTGVADLEAALKAYLASLSRE